jgi:hypothetical protein
VDESLRVARERGDHYNEALSADTLIWLAELRGQSAEPELLARRDDLFRSLGIRAAPHPWPDASGR